MITSIKIQNYESHKDNYLEFPPGLTVFIGDSDKGKSGSFRAFNWVRTNKPLGDKMIPLHWDEGDTIVQVETDPFYSISRVKGKSTNEYRLRLIDEDASKHNAGTDVVGLIKDALDMEDETHFQSQIDRPFLMFETPGERGRILNKIAGIDKIDSCISNANKDIRKIRTQKENIKIQIKQTREELEEYEGLTQIEAKIENVRLLEIQMNGLFYIITKAEKLIPRKRKLETVYNKRHIIIKISQKLKKAHSLNEQVTTRAGLLKTITELKFKRKKLVSIATEENLLPIKAKLTELAQFIVNVEKLEDDYDLINKLAVDRDRKEDRLSVLENRLNNIKKKLPNICPTCGTPLKE